MKPGSSEGRNIDFNSFPFDSLIHKLANLNPILPTLNRHKAGNFIQIPFTFAYHKSAKLKNMSPVLLVISNIPVMFYDHKAASLKHPINKNYIWSPQSTNSQTSHLHLITPKHKISNIRFTLITTKQQTSTIPFTLDRHKAANRKHTQVHFTVHCAGGMDDLY